MKKQTIPTLSEIEHRKREYNRRKVKKHRKRLKQLGWSSVYTTIPKEHKQQLLDLRKRLCDMWLKYQLDSVMSALDKTNKGEQ